MLDVSARQILTAAILTIIGGAATLAALALIGPDWQAYPQATCTATHCFCELPRVGALVVQPANSWSSMGFVLVGFLIMAVARDRHRQSAMPAVAALAFGVTAILVGLGSLLLHATLTLWGQFFDVMGMYLIGAFMLVSAIARWQRLADRPAITLYLLLCAGLIGVLIALPEVRRWLFAVVLLAAIIVELGFARRQRPGVVLGYYVTGMVVQAVGFGIWILDQTGTLCSPQSLIQGHAAWHLLGAVALGMSFLYYRSERRA